jgi:hypothetical protein
LMKNLHKIRSKGIKKLLLTSLKGFIAFMGHKQSKAYNETQAQLVFLHKLCKKVLKTFKVIKTRKANLAEALVVRDKRLKTRGLLALSYAKSRKQAYFWFLTSQLLRKRQNYLSAWLDLYRYRQERSSALGSVLASFHQKTLR